jgi:hypothetical protein
MKQYVKLFEQFTTEKQLEFDFDRKPEETGTTRPEEIHRELGMMGFPSTKTFTFESPIFIQLDYERWFERASQYGVEEFMSQADDLGFDFRYDYKQYQNEEMDEDEFFEAAWEEIKGAGFTEPLAYQGVVQADDFEDDIVNDFNESKLEEYSDVPGVETIRAKEVTRDGNFVVEVVALSDLDIEAMKEELSGQYSDGWGEGYEQQEHEVDGVNYYVHTWRDRGFEIKLINP